MAGNELGIVERKLGKFAEAEAAYQRTIAAEPNYAPAHLNLGVLYDLYLAQPQKALDRVRALHRDCRREQASRRLGGGTAQARRRPGAGAQEGACMNNSVKTWSLAALLCACGSGLGSSRRPSRRRRRSPSQRSQPRSPRPVNPGPILRHRAAPRSGARQPPRLRSQPRRPRAPAPASRRRAAGPAAAASAPAAGQKTAPKDRSAGARHGHRDRRPRAAEGHVHRPLEEVRYRRSDG